MNSVEQLRDIHGLDPIPWGSSLLGAWIIGILLMIIAIVVIWYYRRSKKKQKSTDWQQIALNEWKALSPQSHDLHPQVEQLSVLLKRVAMQRYGRETCASLTGTRWLAWVAQHDPKQFDWVQQGRILIELPYMSPEVQIDIEQINMIYQAVGDWITHSNPHE